ncbi:hypothetical protein E2C01_006802 [Portunus trituberculatus]|uniref:Uncharacterized protein n=1 Tax=Portunus trituberculatus TaxID=210409 RepID=A0A5B7CXA6_PORTR|nr:hypothetical protein [Portunus trituberculatus]
MQYNANVKELQGSEEKINERNCNWLALLVNGTLSHQDDVEALAHGALLCVVGTGVGVRRSKTESLVDAMTSLTEVPGNAQSTESLASALLASHTLTTTSPTLYRYQFLAQLLGPLVSGRELRDKHEVCLARNASRHTQIPAH